MERLSKLSPEKQALLEKRLKGALKKQTKCDSIKKRIIMVPCPLSYSPSAKYGSSTK